MGQERNLGRSMPRPTLVLDVGCGTGLSTDTCLQKCCDCGSGIGIDASMDMLHIARGSSTASKM